MSLRPDSRDDSFTMLFNKRKITTADTQPVADRLGIEDPREIEHLRRILWNLSIANQFTGKVGQYVWVSVDYSNVQYRANTRYYKMQLCREVMTHLRNVMHDAGALSIYMGSEDAGRRTKIKAEGWLLDHLDTLSQPDNTQDISKSEVVMKKDSNGALYDYKDNTLSKQWRREVKAINKVNAIYEWALPANVADQQTELLLEHYGVTDTTEVMSTSYTTELFSLSYPLPTHTRREVPHGTDVTPYHKVFKLSNEMCSLLRVFTRGSVKCGGRLYSPAQLFKSKTVSIRQALLIDGEPVVEIDYGQLHPRLLGAKIGHDFGRGDIYASGDLPASCRRALKLAVMMVINCKTRKGALEALKGEHDRSVTENAKDAQRAILLPTGHSALEVLKAAEKVLAPIKKYWYSDMGIRLQREDSDMALAICNVFAGQNKPIMPVHDSFIVRKQDEQLLMDTMTSVYRDKTGMTPVLDAKEIKNA